MTRNLRPVLLAGFAGTLCALLGAQLGGLAWMLAGFMATLALAFLLKGLADTTPPTTVSVGTTILGAAWIGLGLGHLILLRDIPEHGSWRRSPCCSRSSPPTRPRTSRGRLLGRHKLAPTISPGKTWEGFVGRNDRGDPRPVLRAVPAAISWRLAGGRPRVVIAVAAPVGDLFESALKRDMDVKDTGTLLGGHGGMLDRIDAHLFAVAGRVLRARCLRRDSCGLH